MILVPPGRYRLGLVIRSTKTGGGGGGGGGGGSGGSTQQHPAKSHMFARAPLRPCQVKRLELAAIRKEGDDSAREDPTAVGGGVVGASASSSEPLLTFEGWLANRESEEEEESPAMPHAAGVPPGGAPPRVSRGLCQGSFARGGLNLRKGTQGYELMGDNEVSR